MFTFFPSPSVVEAYCWSCQCCGGKPYHSSSQVRILLASTNARLLDFSNYNFLQMCCRGHVSHRPPNAVCCGTQGYNPNWSVSLKNRLCLRQRFIPKVEEQLQVVGIGVEQQFKWSLIIVPRKVYSRMGLLQ